MKKLITEFKKGIVNNILHIVLMFGILYLIGNHNVAGFQTWPLHEKIWGVGALGFVVGGVLGFIPERIQKLLKVGDFSIFDLIWYGIGGALGAWASVLFPKALTWFAYICIAVYVLGAAYQVYAKYKK